MLPQTSFGDLYLGTAKGVYKCELDEKGIAGKFGGETSMLEFTTKLVDTKLIKIDPTVKIGTAEANFTVLVGPVKKGALGEYGLEAIKLEFPIEINAFSFSVNVEPHISFGTIEGGRGAGVDSDSIQGFGYFHMSGRKGFGWFGGGVSVEVQDNPSSK